MSFSTFDFECRSEIDLKLRGAFVYAKHHSTEPTCLSSAVDEDKPVVWVPDKFLRLIEQDQIRYPIVSDKLIIESVMDTDYAVAFNSLFEYLIWNYIMVPRHGWPELPMEKLHDAQAQCAYHALPMNLEQASLALNLPIQKDVIGNAAMMKICKPRTPLKKEKEADPDWADKVWWNEKPHLLEANINYCGQDVETERLVHTVLPDLPAVERKIWLLDQKINLRGVAVDVENVKAIVNLINSHKKTQLEKFQDIVKDYPYDGGKILSGPLYHVGVRMWVNEQAGLKLKSVDKDAVKKLLEGEKKIPDHVRDALMIRAQVNKSSVAKFTAMLNRKDEDGRVRGWSAYHAASTSRWASWGLQLHNNPRDCYKPEQYEAVLSLFNEKDITTMEVFYDSPYHVASRCVRGALVAPEGKEFICTDFSAIEGRGLAHLAGETWVTDAYRNGVGMYEMSAAEIFGIPYDQVGDPSPERDVGKVAELALGYEGGIGAFFSMAKNYNIDLETLPALVLPHATQDELKGPYGAKALSNLYLKKNRGAMSLEAAVACDIIKRKWRAARPNITTFWKQLESAAIQAIENPGRIYRYRDIKYCKHGDFLKCQMPSGRVMHYYKPRLEMKEVRVPNAPDNHPKNCSCEQCVRLSKTISFMGMKVVDGKTTRQWVRLYTYSGKLAENVTQGFCRDLLAWAMLGHEDAGFPIMMHCHDEDVAEMNEGTSDMNEFNRIAEIVPPWAAGMPIKAKGWIGKRYQK